MARVQIITCNRCGKELSRSDVPVFVLTRKFREHAYDNNHGVDFCSGCFGAFEAWLKAGPTGPATCQLTGGVAAAGATVEDDDPFG